MKKMLTILSATTLLAACGSQQRGIEQNEQGSALASVTVAAPRGMTAGTDFTKITVSYLRGTSGDTWTATKEFPADALTDSKLSLPVGEYTFSVAVYKGSDKMAGTKANDEKCGHKVQNLKGGANTLELPLCKFVAGSDDDDLPPGSQAEVTIVPTILDESASVANPAVTNSARAEVIFEEGFTPTARVKADKSLNVYVKAKVREIKAGQSCTIKAKVHARRSSDQTDQIIVKTSTAVDAGVPTASERCVDFSASELAAYEKATQVELEYNCGSGDTWTALGTRITVENQ